MKKSNKLTCIVHLLDLPENGENYSFSRVTGELNEALGGVLPKPHPYTVDIEIKPIGNIYSISGSWSAELPLICSRCAIDFNETMSGTFNELIVIEDERPRNGKSARVNHSSEEDPDSPFCNYITEPHFDLGTFVYEQISLAQPIRPLGKKDCDDTCSNFIEAVRNGWITPENSPMPPQSPFEALKGFKVNQ